MKACHNENKQECYRCGKCGKKLARDDLLNRHIKLFHSGNTYKCKICDTVFKTKSSLQYHFEAIHAEWSCDSCHKTFSRKASLKRHCKFCR